MSELTDDLARVRELLDQSTDGDFLSRLANGQVIALECAEFIRKHAAAIEAMERDAARYRWLRDSFTWTLTSGTDGTRLGVYMMGVHLSAIGPEQDEFDAAIDAAIEAGR